MKRELKPLLWGIFLIAVGGLSLLHTMGILEGRLDRLAAAVVLFLLAAFFGLLAWGNLASRGWLLLPAGLLASASFLVLVEIAGRLPDPIVPLVVMAGIAVPAAVLHRHDPTRRWALACAWIAGLTGVALALDESGRWGSRLAGPFVLAAGAIPFGLRFLRTGREWTLIVAGILASMSGTALLDELGARDRHQAAALFGGLAVTFAATYVLGRPGKVGWARWAAIACLGFALGISVLRPLLSWGVPVALIAIGAWIIWGPDRPRVAGPGAPPGVPDATG